jgi:hypothetical protein
VRWVSGGAASYLDGKAGPKCTCSAGCGKPMRPTSMNKGASLILILLLSLGLWVVIWGMVALFALTGLGG